MRKINFVFLLFCMAPLLMWAQSNKAIVTLKVDKDTVTIGDMVHLQAQVEYDAQLNISGSGLSELPENEYLEYQGNPHSTRKSSDNSGKKILVEDLDVMVFLDSGWIDFPSVQYHAVMPDTTIFFESNPVRVFVLPVVSSADTPEGLRSIIKEPTKLSDYYSWIFGLISLLFIGGLIYFLRKRKPKEVVKNVVSKPYVAPDKEAILALQQIQMNRLWETAPKEAQIGLSQILRRFMERAYKINALEASTREIGRDLKSVSPNQKALLMKLLNESDLVKFAKLTMLDEHQVQSFKEAITWIKRNKKG